MQHSQAWYRRTSAWVLAVLMLMSIGVVVGFLAPSPLIAQNRTYLVEARADATVFNVSMTACGLGWPKILVWTMCSSSSPAFQGWM